MAITNVQELIEAGVHFGHRASRWHPKMRPFIFGKRNLIHIIDLRETLKGLVRSYNFLVRLTATGKEVVFVGTKRQAKALVIREAQRCGMHWVSERWLGGTLTNYHTIRDRLKRLEELNSMETDGTIETLSKKRISSLRRERRKISRNLEGIRNLKQLPGCLVVVDIRREYIAVKEARKIGIPVVALVDTDCDPEAVDIVVPGNDDAYRSIQVILKILADAVIVGRRQFIDVQEAAEKAQLEAEEAQKVEAQAQTQAPPVGESPRASPAEALPPQPPQPESATLTPPSPSPAAAVREPPPGGTGESASTGEGQPAVEQA